MKFLICILPIIFAICLAKVDGQDLECKCCELKGANPHKDCEKVCEAEHCVTTEDIDDEMKSTLDEPVIAIASRFMIPTSPCREGFRMDERKLCRKVF